MPQAARYLGMTNRGVRQRIARGTLAAERTPSGWLVFLDGEHDQEQHVPEEQAAEQPRGTTEQHREHEGTATGTDESALVTALRAENGWLRMQVEQHAQAESELRRLLAAALQRPMLPSGEGMAGADTNFSPPVPPDKGVPAGATLTAQPLARPWWAFWRPRHGA